MSQINFSRLTASKCQSFQNVNVNDIVCVLIFWVISKLFSRENFFVRDFESAAIVWRNLEVKCAWVVHKTRMLPSTYVKWRNCMFWWKKELGAKCRRRKNSLNQSEPNKIFALSISQKKKSRSSISQCSYRWIQHISSS